MLAIQKAATENMPARYPSRWSTPAYVKPSRSTVADVNARPMGTIESAR